MTLATMAAAITCLQDPGRTLDFPLDPPADWVAKGRAWGEKPTASWRCAAPFQVPIGWRHAGPLLQPMEFAWWVSPGFVASRLGFLQRREFLTDEEVTMRWTDVIAHVDGRIVFLVQLGASPQNDLLQGEQSGRAKTDDLEPVRFVLTLGEHSYNPSRHALVWKQRSRYFNVFTGLPWHQFAPGASSLLGEFESVLDADLPSFGEHHLALYRVEFRLADLKSTAEKMNLVVLSKNKERVAEFRL